MDDFCVSTRELKLMVPHEYLRDGHICHSGFGGKPWDPTPSLVDKDVKQYSNGTNTYQITDSYPNDKWVTLKINTFCEKYRGKTVDYIIYTESKITESKITVEKVRISGKISDGRGRHFIQYATID